MGQGTDAEKLAKKIYSLAYHRATASLARRYPEEFEKLLEAHKNNIRLEYEMFGEIETTRNPRKHVEIDGVCQHDGEEWPCKQEKANQRNRAAREVRNAS